MRFVVLGVALVLRIEEAKELVRVVQSQVTPRLNIDRVAVNFLHLHNLDLNCKDATCLRFIIKEWTYILYFIVQTSYKNQFLIILKVTQFATYI